ncbi:serine/threonine-protein kinase [Amycolatopsis samaneae]|uniref:non-specific serine/threonine protein kinase n=1 Tax=Amycolatopsis samaneae TaxID=664691 RepID=A0ABW5G852_9PSEU
MASADLDDTPDRPADAEPDPSAARVIGGRYRLGRLLGRGSMGTVWAAHDELLRRDVAVKEVLLPPGMPAGAAHEQRERAMREARAIAALSHPNVVTVHDVVREGDDPFVVMELVASVSLAKLIAEHGPLDQPRAAAVADAVAAALQAAHRRGITHRDVKPGNVLLGEDGLVKLTDFGLARSVSEVTLTHAGLMLGTPAYIAPELASGSPTTPAADLWELGATLFAAVAGRPPYNVNHDPLATVHEVVHGDVPSPAGAGPLSAVIAGLMVKDPAARMPLAEVRRLVRPVLPDPGVPLWDVPEVTGEARESRTLPREVPWGAAPASAGEAAPADDGAPLASAPGPLPFASGGEATPPNEPAALASTPGSLPFAATSVAAAPKSRDRSRGRVLGVAAAALVVVAAAVGGIFVFRLPGENPPAPAAPAVPAPSSAPVPAPRADLVEHTGTMRVGEGGPGTPFTITVPRTWVEFADPHAGKGPPPEGIVNYVAPDGRGEIRVERMVGFYDYQRGTEDFVDRLLTLPGVIRKGSQVTTLAPQPPSTMDVFHRNRELGPGPASSTKLRALPHGRDLWTVAVKVPLDQEANLRPLFARVIAAFKPSA